jgi:hypothetical protein
MKKGLCQWCESWERIAASGEVGTCLDPNNPNNLLETECEHPPDYWPGPTAILTRPGEPEADITEVVQRMEAERECRKPGHTQETRGPDGEPTTRRFLKTDCAACVDAALDPFKLALAEARAEADRLRTALTTIRDTAADVHSASWMLAFEALRELGGTRQVPRAIRFYGDEV